MRRKRWWIVLLVSCGLLVLSISINTAQHGQLTDRTGTPIANAFVFYHYSAGTKLFWPWAHYDGPFLTHTDQSGRFTVPFRAHLRFPLVSLTTPVRSFIGAYAPQLHNSCELNFERVETESYCFKLVKEENGRVFAMRDLRADAVARFRTLWLLIYGSRAVAQGPADQRRELIATTRSEYNQFLAEYGSVVVVETSAIYTPLHDWTRENTDRRPWSFFLREVPFYGTTMEERLSQIEEQNR